MFYLDSDLQVFSTDVVQILLPASTDRGLLFLHGLHQLGTGDVTGVNIIAFRRFSQMDISGNVVISSSSDHINTLKVCADLRYRFIVHNHHHHH